MTRKQTNCQHNSSSTAKKATPKKPYWKLQASFLTALPEEGKQISQFVKISAAFSKSVKTSTAETENQDHTKIERVGPYHQCETYRLFTMLALLFKSCFQRGAEERTRFQMHQCLEILYCSTSHSHATESGCLCCNALRNALEDLLRQITRQFN